MPHGKYCLSISNMNRNVKVYFKKDSDINLKSTAKPEL